MRERVYKIRLAETDNEIVACYQRAFIRDIYRLAVDHGLDSDDVNISFEGIKDDNVDAIVDRSR